jgi:lactoylglutathione lyase
VGGKLQLAQQADQDGPIRMGSMWKLYVDTDDCRGLHDAAVAAGQPSLVPPMRLDRWPVSIAFVGDPDGYQVELVQRHES